MDRIEAAARALCTAQKHHYDPDEIWSDGKPAWTRWIPDANAALEAADACGWQDIASAPKEGVVDLWCVHRKTSEQRRFPDAKIRPYPPSWRGARDFRWATAEGLDARDYWMPTHWRETPPPPGEARAEEREWEYGKADSGIEIWQRREPDGDARATSEDDIDTDELRRRIASMPPDPEDTGTEDGDVRAFPDNQTDEQPDVTFVGIDPATGDDKGVEVRGHTDGTGNFVLDDLRELERDQPDPLDAAAAILGRVTDPPIEEPTKDGRTVVRSDGPVNARRICELVVEAAVRQPNERMDKIGYWLADLQRHLINMQRRYAEQQETIAKLAGCADDKPPE